MFKLSRYSNLHITGLDKKSFMSFTANKSWMIWIYVINITIKKETFKMD